MLFQACLQVNIVLQTIGEGIFRMRPPGSCQLTGLVFEGRRIAIAGKNDQVAIVG